MAERWFHTDDLSSEGGARAVQCLRIVEEVTGRIILGGVGAVQSLRMVEMITGKSNFNNLSIYLIYVLSSRNFTQ